MGKKEAQYARVMLALIDRGASPKEAVERVVRYVQNRGHLSLMSRIKTAVKQEAAKRTRRSRIVLTVARERDIPHVRREAAQYLEQAVGAEEPDVRIDETLIGGWTLRTPETFIDASHKKQLFDIYRRVTG